MGRKGKGRRRKPKGGPPRLAGPKPRRKRADRMPRKAAQEQIAARRAQVMNLLARTAGDPSPADIQRLLAVLEADGHKISRATFYRDVQAIRRENEQRLAEAGMEGTIRKDHRVLLRTKVLNDILERTERFIELQRRLGLAPVADVSAPGLAPQLAVSVIVETVQRLNPTGDAEDDLALLAELKRQALANAKRGNLLTAGARVVDAEVVG